VEEDYSWLTRKTLYHWKHREPSLLFVIDLNVPLTEQETCDEDKQDSADNQLMFSLLDSKWQIDMPG
jgi:hypothetical protein